MLSDRVFDLFRLALALRELSSSGGGGAGENESPGADENLRKLKNCGGLVLGCIDADCCNEIGIFQRLARSKRVKHLCTASI